MRLSPLDAVYGLGLRSYYNHPIPQLLFPRVYNTEKQKTQSRGSYINFDSMFSFRLDTILHWNDSRRPKPCIQVRFSRVDALGPYLLCIHDFTAVSEFLLPCVY